MRRSAEFVAALRGGARARRPALTVTVRLAGATEPGEPPRVGLVVGRAVGPAVVRNRVRRRLRHLVRDRLGVLPAGAAVVIRAEPGAALFPSSVLGPELDRALGRALERAEAMTPA
jgi:ribonuclease P protein component